MGDLEISNLAERQRYEAHLDGELVGYSAYEVSGRVISFVHARVYSDFGGRGIASEMARVSLDDARAAGDLHVSPVCSFYRWYIEQHPEYADLVAS